MSDAIKAVTMPKWGLAMEEGTLVAWHAPEGAQVHTGDDLVDIETTKITNVMESTAGGVLRRRVVEEGACVPVGALLGVVADADLPDTEIDAFVARFNADFAVAATAAAETGPPEPEVVEAAGSRISYLCMGEGNPPLVLVHGFGGDLNGWLFNQPALATGRTTYALDLPGHGRSSKDVGTGKIAALADTLTAFLDALNLEQVHLVGHSLGGAIILDLAMRQPERVTSLTLISPAAMGGEINASYIDGFIAAGRRKEMRAVLGLLFTDPALVSRDMVEEVLKYKRLDGVAAALATIAGAAFPGGRQSRDLKSCLGDLRMPVQVIWGRQDRILPVAQSNGLPANVPVHVLDDAGHMAHMEASAQVNALIEDLLRQIEDGQ